MLTEATVFARYIRVDQAVQRLVRQHVLHHGIRLLMPLRSIPPSSHTSPFMDRLLFSLPSLFTQSQVSAVIPAASLQSWTIWSLYPLLSNLVLHKSSKIRRSSQPVFLPSPAGLFIDSPSHTAYENRIN